MRARLALLAALLVSGTVLASPRSHDEPLAFVAVPDAGASVDRGLPGEPVAGLGDGRLADPDVFPVQSHSVGVRPSVAVPPPHLIVVPRQPQPASTGSGRTLRGVASWYCGHGSACTKGYAGGYYAAAGPNLRRGDWRGRTVLVRVGSRSVRVRLIDWCACPHGRLLDLYSDAFSRLVPLSRGLVKVTVTW